MNNVSYYWLLGNNRIKIISRINGSYNIRNADIIKRNKYSYVLHDENDKLVEIGVGRIMNDKQLLKLILNNKL